MIDLARETAEICIDMFAEEITYNGQPARAIVATEVVELPGYEQVTERRMTISVLVGEFPTIESGHLVIVRGKSYRVDQLLEGREDPDVMAKVVLR